MNKQLKQQLTKVENLLEQYFTDYDEEEIKEFNVKIQEFKNFDTKIEEEGIIDCIGLTFIDTESNSTYFYRTKTADATLEEIITQLIDSVYTEEINYRNSVIRNWKSFSARKVKSLAAWLEKGNTEKVTAIQRELIDRLQQVEKYKNQVDFYKRFVRSLYSCKNDLIDKEAS